MPPVIRSVALLTALLLSACSTTGPADPHVEHGDDGPAIPEGTVELPIEATSFSFDGVAIELAVGEEVAVVLTSTDTTHDLVVEELDFHVAAAAGETSRALLRATAPGAYTAWCSVPGHRQAGMETTVTVRSS